jgi:paraquat-inducible protein B
MAKQANRMMIGGFVVAALLILAASLVVFGSGKFFKETEEFVMYFDGSIKGLNAGAPVLFQGVQIGAVKSITLLAVADQQTVNKQVVVEFEPDKFVYEAGLQREKPEKSLPRLIDIGLRAVLSTQSLITGQLMIEVDFFPDTPVNLKNIDEDLLEIPTIPSTTERLAQILQKLDLKAMQESLENTLAGIDRFVNNPELGASVGSLNETLASLRQLVQKLDGKIDALADNMGGAVDDARLLVNNVNRQMDALAKTTNTTVKDFGRLARDSNARLGSVTKSMDKTLTSTREVVSEDAPLVVELQTTLREISEMARAFRQLADYLERHPEALIQGKGEPGGK